MLLEFFFTTRGASIVARIGGRGRAAVCKWNDVLYVVRLGWALTREVASRRHRVRIAMYSIWSARHSLDPIPWANRLHPWVPRVPARCIQ